MENDRQDLTSAILIYANRKVLLLKRTYEEGSTVTHEWELPSGKIEFGETQNDAAIRELQEETGIKVKESELELLGEYNFIYSQTQVFGKIFCVRLNSEPEINLNPEEHDSFIWISSPKEIDELNIFEHHKDKIKVILSNNVEETKDK